MPHPVLSVAATSSVISPFSTAFFLTFSTLIPAPSSVSWIMTLSRSRRACSLTSPLPGFSCLFPVSGSSIPWFTAFLIRWSSGSLRPSINAAGQVRISPPSMINSTSLWSSWGNVAHDTGQAVEDMGERDHADRHHQVLEFGHRPVPPMLIASSISFILCSLQQSV